MSLDIEGAELDALRGLSLDRYRFGAMAIEHNYEEPKRTQDSPVAQAIRLRERAPLRAGRFLRARARRLTANHTYLANNLFSSS
jgi:hypothetical protein